MTEESKVDALNIDIICIDASNKDVLSADAEQDAILTMVVMDNSTDCHNCRI